MHTTTNFLSNTPFAILQSSSPTPPYSVQTFSTTTTLHIPTPPQPSTPQHHPNHPHYHNHPILSNTSIHSPNPSLLLPTPPVALSTPSHHLRLEGCKSFLHNNKIYCGGLP
ncbi:hypothetical protein Pmani_035849 [Petrolisthes manimaculis]|uniref:Uncharacterized protein n=1 Tax=Petrolisthes manimaculis TaxID=1843537 RepID=A0AAE1NJR2_9EUCA|nr:hypothetical protein Pmani_035849 [Petrolisthes manimaculis]